MKGLGLRSCGFIGRNCTKRLSVIQSLAYSISASDVECDELELDDEPDSSLEVATIVVCWVVIVSVEVVVVVAVAAAAPPSIGSRQ